MDKIDIPKWFPYKGSRLTDGKGNDINVQKEVNGFYRVVDIDNLTAQRDRAIEAVEKLREALALSIELLETMPSLGGFGGLAVLKGSKEALAATEPATVELSKCDHCGAIACGTDCDGRSHYTPEKKE